MTNTKRRRPCDKKSLKKKITFRRKQRKTRRSRRNKARQSGGRQSGAMQSGGTAPVPPVIPVPMHPNQNSQPVTGTTITPQIAPTATLNTEQITELITKVIKIHDDITGNAAASTASQASTAAAAQTTASTASTAPAPAAPAARGGIE
jgi:hypothetical protein